MRRILSLSYRFCQIAPGGLDALDALDIERREFDCLPAMATAITLTHAMD